MRHTSRLRIKYATSITVSETVQSRFMSMIRDLSTKLVIEVRLVNRLPVYSYVVSKSQSQYGTWKHLQYSLASSLAGIILIK
jgi:hypothetical protein